MADDDEPIEEDEIEPDDLEVEEDIDEEDIDAVDLDVEELDDELVVDDVPVDDDDAEIEGDLDAEDLAEPPAPAKGEDDDEDDLDQSDPDDVEASLDVILKERLVVQEDENEEDEVPEVDDRTGEGGRVLPKQSDEFVCQSCFLVKKVTQLADEANRFCSDCV